MTEELWAAVDDYLTERLIEPDEALEAALSSSTAAGLPAIQVSAIQGKLLHLLARMTGARHVLEIGTLGGYSTIWLGRALGPSGRLVSLEVNPTHAEVARKNLERAGLSEVVEIRVGRAIETLPGLAAERREPFDLVFIDADKPSNLAYFEWAMRLSRSGSVIVVDNVVRNGGVADPSNSDPDVVGVRRLLDALHDDKRVEAAAIQTVGAKSYDGFAVVLVS